MQPQYVSQDWNFAAYLFLYIYVKLGVYGCPGNHNMVFGKERLS